MKYLLLIAGSALTAGAVIIVVEIVTGQVGGFLDYLIYKKALRNRRKSGYYNSRFRG